MRILGVNAVFHDPAAALVVDGHRRGCRAGASPGAAAVLFALTRPPGIDIRELLITVPSEPSYP